MMVNQKRTPVTKKLACIQPDVDGLVGLGGVEEQRHVPEHHDQVERHQCRPRVRHESADAPQGA
jgi:hypothetical protein